MYSKEDVKFYLKNYNIIKRECEDFLLYTFCADKKDDIKVQKTGRENERNIIKKLDNYKYKRDRHALKCVDNFLNNLSSEDYTIIYARYFNRLTFYDIANKYHYAISTVKRKNNLLLEKLLKKMNKNY